MSNVFFQNLERFTTRASSNVNWSSGRIFKLQILGKLSSFIFKLLYCFQIDIPMFLLHPYKKGIRLIIFQYHYFKAAPNQRSNFLPFPNLGHGFLILCLSKLSRGHFEQSVGRGNKEKNQRPSFFLFLMEASKRSRSVRKKKQQNLMTLWIVFLCLQ